MREMGPKKGQAMGIAQSTRIAFFAERSHDTVPAAEFARNFGRYKMQA
jgi:hypothetical protein